MSEKHCPDTGFHRTHRWWDAREWDWDCPGKFEPHSHHIPRDTQCAVCGWWNQ